MKTLVLASALALALGAGSAMACPKDTFQEQSGNFRWLVQGQFKGQTIAHKGRSIRSLRFFLRQFMRKRYGRRGRGSS